MAVVLLAGGGTAGHVEPALAVGAVLRARGHDVLMLGTAEGAEARLVPRRGFELLTIDKVVLPRRASWALATVLPRLSRQVAAVRRLITQRGVTVVAGFGGYVAMPAYLAAWRRTPYVVFSYDAKVGIANRIGALGTRWRASAHDGGLTGARVTGVPLRSELVDNDRGASRASAAGALQVDPSMPTLLVFGGSSGARRLNSAIVGAAPAVRALGWQVIHIVGSRNDDDLRASAAVASSPGPAWVAVPYLDRMELAYSVADLIVSRSGAMTCAELACAGVPAVLVPYAVGNGEQAANAAPLVASGGYRVLQDSDCTAEGLQSVLATLMTETGSLGQMTEAAQAYSRSGHIRDGAQRLADLIEQAAGFAP